MGETPERLKMTAQPPTTIYTPKLRKFHTIQAQPESARRKGNTYEATFESGMNGAFYKLTLREPMFVKEVRHIDADELRQRLSGEYVRIDVYPDRKSLEFSSQVSFLFALRFQLCQLAVSLGPAE
jgi:hypothetical protein